MGKKNYYVVVANRKDWTLAYPRHLWDAMTREEQKEVVTRQQALFDAMERAKKRRTGAVRRSKHELSHNVTLGN